MSSEGNTAHFPVAPLSLLNSSNPHLLLNQVQGSVLPPPPNLLGNSFSLPHTSPPTNAVPNSSVPASSAANVLKISNLPPDINIREAHLIFSLVYDDIISIDLTDYVITVFFKTLATCITTGKLLDGKFLFGVKFPPVKVDFDNSMGLSGATSTFENLRLTNSAISPSSSHQLSLLQPQSLLHPQAATAGGSAGFENFQKRASVGSQRLRFLFSDPFASTNPNTAGSSGSVSGAPGSIVLGDLTSKSLMMMNPQLEGREFDGLSRDPWAPLNLAFTSNPQTPGLNSMPNAFDWGNSASSAAVAAATVASNAQSQNSQNQVQNLNQSQNQNQNQNQNQSMQAPPPHSNTQSQTSIVSHSMNSSPPNLSQIPMNTSSANPAANERRRTSAFFNGGQSTTNPLTSNQGQGLLVSNSGMSQSNIPVAQKSSISGASTAPSSAPGLSSSAARNGNIVGQSTPAGPPGTSGPSGTSTATASAPVSAQRPVDISSSSNVPAAPQRQPLKDVPDLSLLAKVPPPANPADQNPPCNTLYVGNLPPDATEAELRALFSPQKGFRRLSFRTKNQSTSTNGGASGHNHGPMCFVEFDDVLLATEALADLYGSALPRTNGGSSKGGIRLSFSKNPLGVRGPGNPRRTSTNQLNSANGSTSNGVGNYGYLNYR